MNHEEDRTFDSLTVGDTAFFEQAISEEDVRTFAQVSGDRNSLHMDDAYASSTPYAGRIVHGMFLGALVSRLVGMQLPGKRALLVKESLEFKKPVRIGEVVRVSGVVTQVSVATRLIELNVQITVADMLVADGVVHVQVRPA